MDYSKMKDKLIRENEEKYGEEIRSKYGNSVVDSSNRKIEGLDEASWNRQMNLSEEINQKLREAMALGSPSSDLAMEVCELHREWLEIFWPSGMYSKDSHLSMGQTYVEDQRFKDYYEEIEVGAAEFLYEALKIYCR